VIEVTLMPEPVFYMRGFGDPAASRGMLEDLKAVAGLTDSQVDSIRKRLLDARGFLSHAGLLTVIGNVITDERVAQSVRRAVRNLDSNAVQPFLNSLSAQDEEPRLDEPILKRLREILPCLVQSYPALQRLKKAERLADVTGEAVESVELICDLRPIFDESRKEVEGMMPYTRLRLVVTGVDGLPRAFEAQLSYQQVRDLQEKAEKAITKLEVLRKDVEQWLPGGLPDLPLTRVPSKESDDA
jgi:hypothetical protein